MHQTPNDPNEYTQNSLTKNSIKRKVKNPASGKNPQLAVKDRKLAKSGKSVARKDKGITKGDMLKDKGGNQFLNTGKENIPSTSRNESDDAIMKAEEAAALAYMKNIYMTKGQILLNKFRSKGSIRTAEANMEQAHVIQQTLHNFCLSTGQ